METGLALYSSQLPGKLRDTAHNVLRPDEAVICEFSPDVGVGMILTSMRLIIVRGGLLRTKKLAGAQSAFISLTQVRELTYELRGDETDGGRLNLSTYGPPLPSWASQIVVEEKALAKAFRLAQLLYAMLGQLGLVSASAESLPRPRPVCPVCDAPLMAAIDRKP